MIVLQKIKKDYNDLDMAIAYYSIISVLNELKLQKRELQLVAFIAVKGTITNPAAREDFCNTFKTSKNTIFNLILSLKKKKIIVRDETGKPKINPAIALDFSNPIVLKIILNKIYDKK